MIDPSFLIDLRRLCSIIAPEIDQPIYLLWHPADLPEPHNSGAYTFPATTNVAIRDRLVSRGEWQGPGPTLVLLPDDFKRDTEGNRKCLAGRVLHELTHHLPFQPITDESCDEARAVHLQQYQEWAKPESKANRKPGPPWQQHGLRFTRACLHIHFRTVWHRWPMAFDLDDLAFAGSTYCLSSPYSYRRALGDEPGRMIDKPLTDVLKTPAPQAFADLFRADVEAWHRYQIDMEIEAA